MKVFMGIDPGYEGAIALLTVSNEGSVGVQVWDLPTHIITVNRKKKRRLDLYQIARWFDLWTAGVEKCVIENPSALPKQGVTSAFNFGGACLAMQAFAAGAGLTVELVHPSGWKNTMRLTKDKDAARKRACELFPHAASLLSRAMDHNRAEAILLAAYGMKS